MSPTSQPQGTPSSADFPRGVCIFCGYRGKLSGEHVWPDWLARFIIDDEKAPWVKQGNRGVERIWDAPMFHHEVNRVCKPCNNGWLSRTEDTVKPYMRWMIPGRPFTLDRESQQTLALWCVLRVFMAQFIHGEWSIPAEHYRWIHDHRTPPRGTAVWLASYGGHRYPVFSSQHSLRIAPDLGQPDHKPLGHNGYFATFSVGRFVAQVFGHYIARAHMDLSRPPAQAGFTQDIFPAGTPTVTWPPSRQLSDAGLRGIAQFSL